jgi:hypothetical protein
MWYFQLQLAGSQTISLLNKSMVLSSIKRCLLKETSLTKKPSKIMKNATLTFRPEKLSMNPVKFSKMLLMSSMSSTINFQGAFHKKKRPVKTPNI